MNYTTLKENLLLPLKLRFKIVENKIISLLKLLLRLRELFDWCFLLAFYFASFASLCFSLLFFFLTFCLQYKKNEPHRHRLA